MLIHRVLRLDSVDQLDQIEHVELGAFQRDGRPGAHDAAHLVQVGVRDEERAQDALIVLVGSDATESEAGVVKAELDTVTAFDLVLKVLLDLVEEVFALANHIVVLGRVNLLNYFHFF